MADVMEGASALSVPSVLRRAAARIERDGLAKGALARLKHGSARRYEDAVVAPDRHCFCMAGAVLVESGATSCNAQPPALIALRQHLGGDWKDNGAMFDFSDGHTAPQVAARLRAIADTEEDQAIRPSDMKEVSTDAQ